MKARVNEECIYCGLCADLCPDIFQLTDEVAVVAVDEIPDSRQECCREAAAECPTEAIEIRD